MKFKGHVFAIIVASLIGCGTIKQPVAIIPSVANVALDCAVKATHEAALNIVDDVGSALAGGNWVQALTNLATRWGDEALDCAVQEVFGQTQQNAMASKDPLEATKAARAQEWMAARHRSN